MSHFNISTTFSTLCWFSLFTSVTLVKVTNHSFPVRYKATINTRAVQIKFFHYFYKSYISNVSFNLYLFKRAIFDVMECLLTLINGVTLLKPFMTGYSFP